MKLFGVQHSARRSRIRRFGSVEGPSSYEGPLDLVPGAVAAYSAGRALSASWIGENVVRLRRNSDDAELDFVAGADGFVDVAAVATWAGGDAFCVTLYDQSGGEKDATMAEASQQPQWVANAQNNRPGLQFTKAAHSQLNTTDRVNLPDGESSIAAVFQLTDVESNTNFLAGMNILENEEDPYWEIRMDWSAEATDGRYRVEQWANTNNAGTQLVEANHFTTDISVGLHLFDAAWKFGAGSATLDGAALPYTGNLDSGGVVGQINQRLNLGSGDIDPLSNQWQGQIAEFILYSDIKDMSVCRQNIATYYGITLA